MMLYASQETREAHKLCSCDTISATLTEVLMRAGYHKPERVSISQVSHFLSFFASGE